MSSSWIKTILQCVGYFSLDEQRQYHPDASQLRFLHLPPSRANQIEWRVRFDLRSGIQEAVEKDQEKVKNHMLDDMLTWILQERKAKHSFVINVDSPLRTLETEFVCFRGLLTLISCTPYLPQDSWSILATQFQKTVYLWQLKEGDDCHRNPRLREMALWGFKFEQYLCAGTWSQHFQSWKKAHFKFTQEVRLKNLILHLSWTQMQNFAVLSKPD